MNQRIIRIIAIVIILISCFVSGFSAGYIIKMLPETVAKSIFHLNRPCFRNYCRSRSKVRG